MCLFDMTIIALVTYDNGLWFRLFGYGFSVQIASKSKKYFSERNGIIKPLYFLGIKWQFLNKEN